MSTPAQMIEQLKAQIEASAHLSYVRGFFIGVRESITLFPAVFIEPRRNDELSGSMAYQDLTLTVELYGYISERNADKQIIGDSKTRGIIDLENDLKKAISSDRTLGGYAVDSRIIRTQYGRSEYPARSIIIDVEIDYRQDSTERA